MRPTPRHAETLDAHIGGSQYKADRVTSGLGLVPCLQGQGFEVFILQRLAEGVSPVEGLLPEGDRPWTSTVPTDDAPPRGGGGLRAWQLGGAEGAEEVGDN